MENDGGQPEAGQGPQAPVAEPGDFTIGIRVLLIIGIAVLVGIAGTIVGWAVLRLIELVTNLAYFGKLSVAYVPFGRSPLGTIMILVPIIGSLIVGLIARYGSEQIRGHGIPEAIEAILLGHSRMGVKVAILKPLASAIAIGTGGPFGAEGPIIMTGGAIGSLIAQALPVSDEERKTLLVAGAAAGMTTVFGTPLSAIMLAVEVLLFEWTPRSVLPVATACIVSEIGRGYLGLASPLFPFTGGMAISLSGFGSWVLAGICTGLLSVLVTEMMYACEDGYRRLPVHWMWWPMLGGLAVGIGGLIDPDALGVGYAHIAALLQGSFVPLSGLLLLVVKAIIWSVALASGTSGGVLAPLMLMGGGLGAAATGLLPLASPGFWSLLGMAGTLGGALRAPLTAIFFAVEVTGNIHVLFPLVVTCVTSYLIAVLLLRHSILTEKVARHGHPLTLEYHADPFAMTEVSAVMVKDVETLPPDMRLDAVGRRLADPATRHPSFPVLDQAGRVLGIVDPPRVAAWRHAGEKPDASLGELFAGHPAPIAAYPDELLATLIERMMEHNVAHLPVISRADARLMGYVAWKDLLRVHMRQREDEERRTRFFRMRVP